MVGWKAARMGVRKVDWKVSKRAELVGRTVERTVGELRLRRFHHQ